MTRWDNTNKRVDLNKRLYPEKFKEYVEQLLDRIPLEEVLSLLLKQPAKNELEKID